MTCDIHAFCSLTFPCNNKRLVATGFAPRGCKSYLRRPRSQLRIQHLCLVLALWQARVPMGVDVQARSKLANSLRTRLRFSQPVVRREVARRPHRSSPWPCGCGTSKPRTSPAARRPSSPVATKPEDDHLGGRRRDNSVKQTTRPAMHHTSARTCWLIGSPMPAPPLKTWTATAMATCAKTRCNSLSSQSVAPHQARTWRHGRRKGIQRPEVSETGPNDHVSTAGRGTGWSGQEQSAGLVRCRS